MPVHSQPLQNGSPLSSTDRPSVFSRLGGATAGQAASVPVPQAPTESPTGAGFHHPTAAALQGPQAPVQMYGINFGVPTTASHDVNPMQSDDLMTGATSGAEPTPFSAVKTASTAQSPVEINGFFFGVPSGASGAQTAATEQTSSSPPDSPVRSLLIRPASLMSPSPVEGVHPAPLAPATPAQPVLQQQQQQPDPISAVASGKSEQKKDLSISGLLKLRTGFGLESLLAAADNMVELETPAPQSAPADAAAAAAQPATAGSAHTDSAHVSVTITRAGAGVTAPVTAPVGTILAELLHEYSQYSKQPFDDLCVTHCGEVVEHGKWGLSFGQLAWGPNISLEVDFAVVTAAPADGQPAAPDTIKAAVAVSVDSSTGAGTVHLTVNREGHEPVMGPVPTTAKLGALLTYWASERGLSLEALQVLFKGTVVDRSYWESTFAELGCGSSLVLDFQVQPQQAALAEAGAPQQHNPLEQSRSQGKPHSMTHAFTTRFSEHLKTAQNAMHIGSYPHVFMHGD